jgi:hypothetical protein
LSKTLVGPASLSPHGIAQLAVDRRGSLDAAIEELMPLLSILTQIEGAKQEAALHNDFEGVA